MDNKDIRDFLLKQGVKPSLHRMKILEYILKNRNHPTADIIYRDISGEIPTLSKTTVYNTLNTFLENKVVQPINIEDNEVRYDGTLEKHAHFKCVRCSGIYDLKTDSKALNQKTIDGHIINESHLYYKGICGTCK